MVLGLDAAYLLVQGFTDRNARHLRKNFRLLETPLADTLKRAKEELQELVEAPDDIDEMADTLANLLHYSVRKGWSTAQLYAAVSKKLNMRFAVDEDPVNDSNSQLPGEHESNSHP